MDEIINKSKFKLLKQYFGHTEFRDGQEEIIDAIINNRDVVAIMPTAAGKSICYQLPALMKNGITLVVSPLISLMTDQVLALQEIGIKAAYVNSSLPYSKIKEIYDKAIDGEYKIIYVAPERLMSKYFLRFARKVEISMIVIDEAHCISEWGHDFRPEYRRINEFIYELKKRPVVAAFTATATQQVKNDIIISLELRRPVEVVTGFNRENLFFEIYKSSDKFARLYNIVTENDGKSILVYCLTRALVEEVYERLCHSGFPATKYHAGMSEKERERSQFDFQNDIKTIMVATNAFGMGINKSNISIVIHYNMPKSIENYYQEAGRAGRDGSEARCILLYAPSDIKLNNFIIDKYSYNYNLSTEENKLLRYREQSRLLAIGHYCETSDCLRKTLLRYFDEGALVHCGKCTNCCSEISGIDITDIAQKIFLCVSELEAIHKSFGKGVVAEILKGKCNDKRIKKHNADEFESFGSLSGMSEVQIGRYIQALVDLKLLRQRKEAYHVITFTLIGKRAMRKKEKIICKLKTERKNFQGNEEDALYIRLKKLRTHISARKFIPPYVIFTDMTLREMCKKMPVTNEEFLEIPGVGKAKLENYGEEFMNVIRKHLEYRTELDKNE